MFIKKSNKNTRKLHLVSNSEMPFAFVESYKSLRTNLKFISKTNNANCFVVTSSIPEEGKSNVVINLAATLGNSENKVLVIDCDLRKPAINKYLKFSRNHKGLTNIIAGEISLEEAIDNVPDLNIDVLLSGTIPPNPSEILASNDMKELIDYVKKQYDYILIDTPPVSVVTDAAILGTVADGAVLVIKSKFASSDIVRKAIKSLDTVGVKIFGVIVSQFNPKKSNRSKSSYSYSYNYYGEDK